MSQSKNNPARSGNEKAAQNSFRQLLVSIVKITDDNISYQFIDTDKSNDLHINPDLVEFHKKQLDVDLNALVVGEFYIIDCVNPKGRKGSSVWWWTSVEHITEDQCRSMWQLRRGRGLVKQDDELPSLLQKAVLEYGYPLGKNLYYIAKEGNDEEPEWLNIVVQFNLQNDIVNDLARLLAVELMIADIKDRFLPQ